MTSAVAVFATAVPATMTVIAVITTAMPASPVRVATMPAVVSAINGAAYITIAPTPVVGIPYITAVADDNLVVTAAVACIMIPVVSIANPGVTFVNNHLITIVNVIIPVSYR